MKLTKTDWDALLSHDSSQILNKGAKLYNKDTYAQSVEYYRLAAAMGNVHAVSDLGYCYLYGRDIPQDVDLGIAYFLLAAKKGDIDALYKLGDIFSRDTWVEKDVERSNYYFLKALQSVLDEAHTGYGGYLAIRYADELESYPSLCLALGAAMSEGGNMNMDLPTAYELLLHAKHGYEEMLRHHHEMYQKSYENTLNLLKTEQFDHYRRQYEEGNDDSSKEE